MACETLWNPRWNISRVRIWRYRLWRGGLQFDTVNKFANGCVFYDVTQGDIVGACGTSPGQNKNTPRHTLNNLWLPSIAWDTKDESPSLY
jgi:hypothetical protein